jgi:BioD-like phosphotransacetylase family protein
MDRNIYLTAIEPGSGKSAVALGVMEALASSGRSWPPASGPTTTSS